MSIFDLHASVVQRMEMRQRQPQILLTNYVMAELVLVRPEDQRFLDRVGGGLRYLLLDELHTYRGRGATARSPPDKANPPGPAGKSDLASYQRPRLASHLQWLRSLTDSRSDIERAFVMALATGFHRLPMDAQRGIDDPRCIPDFFYAPNVCVFCDGRVLDDPAVAAEDARIRPALAARGYRVAVIRYDRDLAQPIADNVSVFGRAVQV